MIFYGPVAVSPLRLLLDV